ncbi:N-acetylglucosamine-6-phosphate deacetylase [Cellulosilyticum sp. I15G10I2]|uniref:N-acetylglucosamine-6-phosphate deacetylase n=1 Tax=Cellulosilyticum sp. I15G10I2 TaxID=1892843 RepID=UPI00085BB54D|nr:N-acetylglucosamine-6-phosphate deacetylase [Cellulosilyticum sp. I15G10I2]
MLIKNCKIIYTDRIEDGSVLLKNGKIAKVNPELTTYDEVIDAKGLYLSPGFIDVHIHGAGGHDTMEGTYHSLNEISKAIVKHGTTSFLATTMTCPTEEIKQAVYAVYDAMLRGTKGANILGIHLEGPFISPFMIGAQNPLYLQKPSIEAFENIVGPYRSIIKSVTLAPEIEGADELIRFLSQHQIVASIGHSKATYREAMHGINEGMSHITHLYNAMTGLHHRDAGVIGAAFLSDVTAETICDGIHIDYPALCIAFKQKSIDNILLVSDAMMACCMPPGSYVLGGQNVIAKDGSVHLENGALAGSVLTLNKAIKNVWTHTNYTLFEVVQMATYNPAKHAQVHDKKGLIAEGFDADLVLFDENIEVQTVIVGGNIIA